MDLNMVRYETIRIRGILTGIQLILGIGLKIVVDEGLGSTGAAPRMLCVISLGHCRSSAAGGNIRSMVRKGHKGRAVDVVIRRHSGSNGYDGR